MVTQSLIDVFSKCLCNCHTIKLLFFSHPAPLQPDLENNLNGNICVPELKKYDEVGNWEYVDDDHRKANEIHDRRKYL